MPWANASGTGAWPTAWSRRLFEQAKVAANHLALHGIGRYEGSVTSTKLKVTGIDVFSAGDFVGDGLTEAITLADPSAGVYKSW